VGVNVSASETAPRIELRRWARPGGFARAAVATLSMRIAARALALPTALVLARVLGPSEYGKYAYGLSWGVALGVVAVAGLDRYLVKAVARYTALGDPARLRGVAGWGARTAMLTSLFVAGVFAAIAPLFVGSSFLPATWICLALVPMFALTNVRQAVMQGLHRVELSCAPEQIVLPVALLVLLGAVLAGRIVHLDAASAAAVNLIAYALAFVVGVVLVRRSLAATTERVSPRREWREWTRSLPPFALVGFVTLAQVQAGVLILGSLGRAADAGAYQVAGRIAEVASVALVAINAPLAPRAAHLFALGRRGELAGLATRTARAGVAVCLPLALLAVVFRGPLLGLFGSGYGAGATALVLLVCAQLFSALIGSVGVLLMMSGGERAAAAGFTAGLLVCVGSGIALASHYGATGAALGQLLGIVCWNVVLWIFVRRRLGIDASALGLPPRKEAARV